MPDMIGRYLIECKVESNPHSTVYKTTRQEDLTRLAIKVFHSDEGRHHTPPIDFLTKFQRYSQLEFPSILPILDHGEMNGEYYCVMPFMPGGNLAEKLKEEPIPLQTTLRVLSPIAKALDHAHAHGIVHGNLKPANILFDSDGTPFLADFLGLPAKTLQPGSEEAVLTSADFISPEQIDGEAPSPSTDIYSFGVIVYRLLAGSYPFQANTHKGVLFLHATKPPRSAHELNPQLPPVASRMLNKVLAKDPQDRYPSASEFISNLTALDDTLRQGQLQREGIAARPQALTVEEDRKQVVEVQPKKKSSTVWAWIVGISIICLFWYSRGSPGGSRRSRNAGEIQITHIVAETQDFSATHQVQPVVERTPLSAEQHFRKGTEEYDSGQYSKAILSFSRAIILDPQFSPAYFARGRAYHFGKEDYERAVEDYIQGVELDPDNATGLNNLAWTLAYHLDRDYFAALGYAKRSVAINPNEYNQDTLAWVYYKMEDYELAMHHFEIALSLDESQAISYLGRGHVHRALGDIDAAFADYQTYLSLDLESPEREEVLAIIDELERE